LTPLPGRLRSTLDERQIVSRQPDKVVLNETITVVPNQTIIPIRRFFSEISVTHPYAVRRVSEVMRWVQSGDYDRIIRGEYRTRDQKSSASKEAGDAMEFYTERFRAAFRDVGENVTSLGTQVGGVADQVTDWFRSRGTGSES